MHTTSRAIVRDALPSGKTSLEEIVLQLVGEVRELSAEIRSMRAERRGSQALLTQSDRALLLAIAGTVAGHAFSSSELFAHATVAAELQDAMHACDIRTVKQLGKACRRIAGCIVNGFVLERIGADNNGAVWSVRVAECETPHSHHASRSGDQ